MTSISAIIIIIFHSRMEFYQKNEKSIRIYVCLQFLRDKFPEIQAAFDVKMGAQQSFIP